MVRRTTAARDLASTDPRRLRVPLEGLLALVLGLVLVACGGDDVTVERSGGAAPLTADRAVTWA